MDGGMLRNAVDGVGRHTRCSSNVEFDTLAVDWL
jgi:hypothetical protein